MTIENIFLIYLLIAFLGLGEISKIGIYFLLALLPAIFVGITFDSTAFRVVLGVVALFSSYRFGQSVNVWK